MGWLHSFWQKAKKPLKIAGIILTCALVIGLIISFIGGYFFNWTWTGFGPYTPPTKDSNFQREKTLWDWLQLFFIPAAIAFGVLWFSRLQQQRDQLLADQRAKIEREAAEELAVAKLDIALSNQRALALQGYLDKMSELLLHENLRKSDQDAEVRNIAQVLALTVLHRLDGWRKRNVLEFLQESGLIDKGKSIVDLYGADLRGADLRATNLSEAKLSNTMMSKADLRIGDLSGIDLKYAHLGEARLDKAYLDSADMSQAKLHKASLCKAVLGTADLSFADLSEADLTEADLTGANLSYANLTGAKVTTEQLDKASSLQGATMPDGTKHD